MNIEKDGVHFITDGHIVKCDGKPEICTKRLYNTSPTPDDVNVITPEGVSNIVAKCPIISENGENFICSYQIEGIQVESKNKPVTNLKPQ